MDNESQLDISAPLLSARKHLHPRGTAVGTEWIVTGKSPRGGQFALFVDRSEWELEEVTKPAAVPFQWENSPGKAKRDCLYHSDEEPAITPRPPPGRFFEACTPRPPSGKIHSAQILSGEVCRPSRLLLPGRIFGEICSPRLHPGRLVGVKRITGEVRTPLLSSERLTDVRHISGGKSSVQNNSKYQCEAFTNTEHAYLLESLKESLDADGESGKESGDEVFADALDTLSPNKSSSLNSSVSRLSSSYHRNCGSAGNFSVDLQTRDFMMSRFLPAAEAAVVRTPRHVPVKPTVVIGKTVKKAIPSVRESLLKQPGLNARPSSNQRMEYLEIEDEDVEYDDNKVRIGKTCGVFRRLCIKHAASRSNPKSGMKLTTKPSKSSSGEVKKPTRNAYSGPVDKYAYAVNCKKVYPAEVTSQELPKVCNKLKDESKKISFLSNSYKMTDRQSPTACPKSGRISPIWNERPPIMEKCNREDNFLGTEELESGKKLVYGQEESNCSLLLPPIPIPLPKSPSESWLCHTRPSVPLRNPFSDSQAGGYLQNVSKNNNPSTGPKWEKFVQSSKVHHDNVCYSKELQIQGPSQHDGQ